MDKKYELIDKFTLVNGIGLQQIRALRDFGNVRSGDIGGYIESEDNLSHEGNCWISDNACVLGDAQIFDDAIISDIAYVYESGWVSGEARVCGYARVSENAKISGDARIYENAWIYGEALVSGNALVSGEAQVFGDAKLDHDIWNMNIVICKKWYLVSTTLQRLLIEVISG